MTKREKRVAYRCSFCRKSQQNGAQLIVRPGQVAVVAQDQAVDGEKVQKYFETGESPLAPPAPAQNMR